MFGPQIKISDKLILSSMHGIAGASSSLMTAVQMWCEAVQTAFAYYWPGQPNGLAIGGAAGLIHVCTAGTPEACMPLIVGSACMVRSLLST